MQKIILWLTTRLFFPVLVVAAFSYNCLASDTTPPIYVEPPQLGIPLKLPQQIEINTTQFLEQYSIPADRTGDWSVDIGNRQASRALYNSVYLASESIPDGWTGDVASCTQGTTSSEFKNGVLVRVNYFREMAGVPSDIIFNSLYSDKSQQAALLMSRNDNLSHSPPNTWPCYTVNGAEAAGKSNLSLGNYGWDAVDGQMRDNGANNGVVGHRRWILYPQTQQMGTGDIPNSNGFRNTNSLWVQDGNWGSARPTTREFYVAWPPPGYVPYSVVSARWSFSYDKGGFSNASVSMSRNGISVPVAILPSVDGYGENTLVWVPDNLNADLYYTRWPMPQEDTTYQVTVSNFTIQGSGSYSTSYDVTVFDPSVRGDNEELAVISGSGNPKVGTPSEYTFSPVSIAESYEVMLAELKEGDYLEGGENGPDNLIDSSDPSYDLITNETAYSGTYSLHLAHPNPTIESFELDKTFIPSATSVLQFSSRLGWSTSDESVKLQISQDDGKSWETVYNEAGISGTRQSEFSLHSIPLDTFTDSFIRIRFVYHFDGGSYYPGSSLSYGVVIDDIQIQNGVEIISSEIYPFDNRAFALTGSDLGPFVLAVRAVPWNGYPGIDWGPFFYLTMGPHKVELKNAIEMLISLGSGSTTYSLTDVINVLQVLTGN